MHNIREFKHKLIEVSHVQIAIQVLKLRNLEVRFWGIVLNPIGNNGKSNMKMGQNLDPRLYEWV